jgi:lipoyl(octanoyl) transferase
MDCPVVEFQDLGLLDYKEAWDCQTSLFKAVIDQKIYNRKNPNSSIKTKNYLLFCEHPHVYTLGTSGSSENLLISESILKKIGATYYKINRGGDITYHGPGQLVAYPIFDLDYFFSDIHKYLRFLEESVILTLNEYGIIGGRIEGLTGVWVDIDSSNPRKICALGVKSSRWVTMHGIGFNVNTDLSYFDAIVPCGIKDKAVTSVEKELGEKVNFFEIKNRLRVNLSNVFDFNYEKTK